MSNVVRVKRWVLFLVQPENKTKPSSPDFYGQVNLSNGKTQAIKGYIDHLRNGDTVYRGFGADFMESKPTES